MVVMLTRCGQLKQLCAPLQRNALQCLNSLKSLQITINSDQIAARKPCALANLFRGNRPIEAPHCSEDLRALFSHTGTTLLQCLCYLRKYARV